MKTPTFTSAIAVTLIGVFGTDRSIAEAAWTSTGAKGKTDADVAGLIPYLVRQKHGVPFEHAVLTIEVHSPIFVKRQIVKHRHISYSEESARYHELEPVFYIPASDRPMVPTATHKPARPDFEAAGERVYRAFAVSSQVVCQLAWEAYQSAIAAGIAPETARNVLPVSIYSTARITLNLRAVMHFLGLRIKSEDSAVKSYAQYEVEQVGKQVEALFAEHFPITHKAFVDAKRVTP